jgi:branched-subunit amino acid transport protein AzlD
MNNIDYKLFGKHILMSGLIVGIFAYLAEKKDQKLAGFLYMSLPLGFLYIFLMTNMTSDQKKSYSEASIFGCLLCMIYIGILYLLMRREKFNMYINLAITTVVFMILLYLINRYIYKFMN